MPKIKISPENTNFKYFVYIRNLPSLKPNTQSTIMSNLFIVPIDFEEQSMISLEQAGNLAYVLKSDIILLHVMDEPGSSASAKQYHKELKAEIKDKLEVYVKNLSNEYGLKVSYEIRYGKPYQEICDFAEEKDATLIIMGSNKYKGIKRFIGSNSLRVVRQSSIPVITIKGKSHKKGCERILLPLDLTKETREKVARCLEFARAYGAEVHVVSVNENDSFEKSALERQMNQVKTYLQGHDIKVVDKFLVKSGSIAQTILKYGMENDVDLIMIMTQQEQNITDLFIGSQAQDIINNSEIPVLSVIPRTQEVSIGSIFYS